MDADNTDYMELAAVSMAMLFLSPESKAAKNR
jgi:hypothetical protein